jgi:segregation and condensation protein A
MAMNGEFTIQTDIFEGPFSTLLELIEKHKLSINEVSLSKITDEYISYISQNEEIRVGELSQFIVVAATLMLIKSRTLLPGLVVTEEEKSDIEVLTNRLEVFQIVKAISGYVREQYGKYTLFRRPFVRVRRKIFAPGTLLTQEEMLSGIHTALLHIPKETVPPETRVKKQIQIEEILTGLLARVQRESSFRFSDFAKSGDGSNYKEIKTFIVVSFLAMLELIKNGTLDATQSDIFGEITIQAQHD